jgi:hypothetical protein
VRGAVFAVLCLLSGPALAEAPASARKPYFLKERPADATSAEQAEEKNVTAEDLRAACEFYFEAHFQNRERVARKQVCNGFFFGLASSVLALRSQERLSYPYCFPGSLSTEDAVRAFLDWSKTAQSLDRYLAAEAALIALEEKYPCREAR